MFRRNANAVVTLSGPGDFDTGPWLLAMLCLQQALVSSLFAINSALVVKAGYLLTGFKSPRDLVCLVSIQLLTATLLAWAGILALKNVRANGIFGLLLAALGASLLLSLFELWRDANGATVLVFGDGRRVGNDRFLAGVHFLQNGWSVLILLAPVLIAFIRRADPGWPLVTFCWLTGSLLEELFKRRLWPLSAMDPQEIAWSIPPQVLLFLVLVALVRFRRAAGLLLLLLILMRIGLIGWSAYESILSGFPLHANWAAKSFMLTQAFVEPPLTELAPLVLIVGAGRWRTKIGLPDDGSPWPRRYCGKCFYNLHGVESDRCPECGANWGTVVPIGQLVERKMC